MGIDALDWEILNQLIKEEEVPHFEMIKRRGVSAKINLNEPNEKGSAVFWTSIATGQLSDKHGIDYFVTQSPDQGKRIPYTSNMRKTKAFWNILSENDISVGIVGWYLTWPAERIKGFMVSSYYALKDTQQPTWKGTIYEGGDHMVYPPKIQAKVDGYIQEAKSKCLENIKNIIKPEGLEIGYGYIEETKWAFLTDQIYHEIGINLYKEIEPQVFAVYFEGVDVVGHRFTFPKKAMQKHMNHRFGNVQRNYYLYMDRIIRSYIEEVDENTLFIVAADHGLMRGHHTNNGVFMIFGPGIKKNTWSPEPMDLTDIVPTILYALGLPIAKDMDGEPHLDIFTHEFLENNKVKYIRTYGKRKDISESPMETQFDEEILRRLKSLGYIK